MIRRQHFVLGIKKSKYQANFLKQKIDIYKQVDTYF